MWLLNETLNKIIVGQLYSQLIFTLVAFSLFGYNQRIMNIAILGFGIEGNSSANYWSQQRHDITICDQNPNLKINPPFKGNLGANYLANLEQFDLIVRSPGIHPRDIVAANSSLILRKITSNTNQFFNVSPTKNIIAVTGTKGKGTTTSLITKMLNQAGIKAYLGGNIGNPALNLLDQQLQADDWVVLELSNFQLIDLQYSPHLAVCLLVEPEHLDWHQSIREYVEAKQQLFTWQRPDDTAIYYALSDLSKRVVSVSKADKLAYYQAPGARVENDSIVINDQTICSVKDIKLLGKHNWQNICAAVTAVWQVTNDQPSIASAISNFSGLPYRLELRQEAQGVSYYNDSFSSQPEAAIAAIEAITQPKVIILGGFDRGLKLSRLAKTIQDHDQDIIKCLLIGASAQRIADNLNLLGYSNYFIETSHDMSDIIATARNYTKPGSAIILSPGFPSFDMFLNFEERGKAFNLAIE